MKTQVILAIVAFLALSTSAQAPRSYFCGRKLSETLVRYCPTGMNAKRSESWIRTQLFGAGYWLTPQQAVGMGRGKRQQGVATECCVNSCTISELLSYCPED